nr:hypothetical protein [Micromonospora sp. DSM 115978]
RDARDEAALAERFSGPLRFGTAGLRGPLRAGPSGMNTAVVRRTAAGLADWLLARAPGPHPPSVVVGYDARHRSAEFALDSVRVLAAAGAHAMLLPRPLPTPVLAFAVRHLDADAGIMVTASHNPASDNGYKVYLGGPPGDPGRGAQLVPPADAEIEAAIGAVGRACDVPLADSRPDGGTWRRLGDDVVTAYVRAAAVTVPPLAGTLQPGMQP